MQTYKFRNEFTALSKKLEDATKINLKTCMKCRTDGSNFVNKIRMQCVFLLRESHADTKTGRKKPSVPLAAFLLYAVVSFYSFSKK